jgi:hypothetical protein
MIISASRRTDLPAFFPEQTIKEILKLCKTEQTSIIPSKVPQHGVVFWTKNPEPIFPYLSLLDKNNIVYYFQYTFNDYPEFEPNVPSQFLRLRSYITLGRQIGFDKIKVRFDPILVGVKPSVSLNTVLNRYNNLSYYLRKATTGIIFSFVDYYPKLPSTVRTLTDAEMKHAVDYLVEKISPRFDLYSCAEGINHPKIKPNKCIDPEMFISMGMKLDDIDTKDKSQRLLCKCYPSKDIGEYHTCKHNCHYCYSQ